MCSPSFIFGLVKRRGRRPFPVEENFWEYRDVTGMNGGMYGNLAVARRNPAVFDQLAHFGLVL